MDVFVGLIALTIFIASGLLIGNYVFRENESLIVRAWLGISIGLALMMWIPALLAFLIGFTQAAQIAALLIAAILGGLCYYLVKKRPINLPPFDKKSMINYLACIVPLFAIALYLLHTHTILNIDGELHAGQSTFGDMAMHLGFITSISEQQAFPPYYSILPKTPMGYPFLCDSISSTLYSLGVPLRDSYILPMIPALFCVLSGGYLIFKAWLKEDRKAILAYALFFIGAGFGFAYFFEGFRENPENFFRIFNAFYETPTNYTTQNIIWVNPIADVLIPQRATLFGWTILFPCLYLLYKAAFYGIKKYFLPLGILAACLPLIHTHSFLALGLVSAVLLLRAILNAKGDWKALAPWGIYALIAIGLAMPQLLAFTFKQSDGEGFLRLAFNWVNQRDNYFWFYIKNIGIAYLLLIPAFLYADKDSKWLYCSGLLILFISEFIVFQPNAYDNNKLLFIWYLLGCGIVSSFMIAIYDRIKGMKGIGVLCTIALGFCFIGGIFTLMREAKSDFVLFSKGQVELSIYVKEKTPPQSTFLTATNHNNAIAALTGRNIVCGSSSYVYFHGLDYQQAEAAVRQMYEAPSKELLEEYNVDYALISSFEGYGFSVDYIWFEKNCKLIYENDELSLFEIQP